MPTPSVAVVAYPNVSPFHLSVPCILFGDILPGEQLFSLTVCAAEDGPIAAAHGMSVAPGAGLEALASAHIEGPDPLNMNAVARDTGPVALPTVLFVDDDAGNRQAFQAAFRNYMHVLLAANLQEAWAHLTNNTVHVVIADQRMPRTTGSELLSMVRDRLPHVRRMLVTAYADLEAIIDAVNNGGVTKYFAKPWVSDPLVKAVHDAFAEIAAEAQRDDYTRRLEESNRQLEFALRQRLLS